MTSKNPFSDNYPGNTECTTALAVRENNPRLAWQMLLGCTKYRMLCLQDCAPDAPSFEHWTDNFRGAMIPLNYLLICLQLAIRAAGPLNRLASTFVEDALSCSETIWQSFNRSMSPFDVAPEDVPYKAALSYSFLTASVLDLLAVMEKSDTVAGETYKWQPRAARANQVFQNTSEQKKSVAACYPTISSANRQPYDPSILHNGTDPEIQVRQRYL